MARIAVDVVVLPEADVSERAIRANAALATAGQGEIVLGEGGGLPHVSLCMGCLDERDLTAVEVVVRAIAAGKRLTGLRITQTYVCKNAQGRAVSCYAVERTRELQTLHETVMRRLGPMLTYDVAAEMLSGGGRIAETTLEWIRTYPEQASFEKFLPHITLGYGAAVEDPGPPIASGPGRLAVCRLGNHCTCREVLVAVPL